MEKIMRLYYVWPKFPSISITGSACALNCRHCNKVYLKHMIAATTPAKLLKLCKILKNKGAQGVLISGGCDSQGNMLNLRKFLLALKKVHEMGLIIKLHTGFVDPELAQQIVESGTDIASMEFVGDTQTITEIFGIDATTDTYLETFRNLQNAGMPFIAPHIAVGLHYGKLTGEVNALKLMKDNGIRISTIAVIVFRPTKGTQLANLSAPEPGDVATVVRAARRFFPNTKIILGAMRPRSSTRNDPNKNIRFDIELAAVRACINGVEIPSPKLIRNLKQNGYKLKRLEAYGVLPIEYEERVGFSWL